MPYLGRFAKLILPLVSAPDHEHHQIIVNVNNGHASQKETDSDGGIQEKTDRRGGFGFILCIRRLISLGEFSLKFAYE